jgi:MFS family permease
MLLTALTFFAGGSFLSAVTGKFTGLLLGRTIQGIGAGGVYSLSNLIVRDLNTVPDRQKWGFIIGTAYVLRDVF